MEITQDIINKIFSYLDFNDLILCQKVCKKWYGIIKYYQLKRIFIQKFKDLNKSIKKTIVDDIEFKNFFYHIIPLPLNLIQLDYQKFPNIPSLKKENEIMVDNNSLYFFGSDQGGNRIVMADIPIGEYKKYSRIPFVFPIKFNNNHILKLSNIYYYEITVDSNPFRESWDDECISIGFGKRDYPLFGYQVGWLPNSIGIHSDDGNIYHSMTSGINLTSPWGKGDTIGCGLIMSKNYVYPFFTRNGKFIGFSKKINSKISLFPIICLDSSYKVSVNMSNQEFKFNILDL